MTRFGSVSDVRTVSSMKPGCCRRIGRTFSLIVFASSCDFPGLVLTSTTRVNMGSSPFVGYGLKGTSREMRGAGCHSIFWPEHNATPVKRASSRPGTSANLLRFVCSCKICEVNWIGANQVAGRGSQFEKIGFFFARCRGMLGVLVLQKGEANPRRSACVQLPTDSGQA